MDAYRRVYAQLACKRCGVENRFEVTFRAGPLGPNDTFGEGQPIAAEEGIEPGEVFRGRAGRYCLQCLKDWQRAETSARGKAMAQLALDGRLVLRPVDAERPLTPDDIAEWARAACDDVTAGHGAPPAPTQNWVEFAFSWEGEEAFPAGRAHQDCNREIDGRVETELARSGWRWGRNLERYNLRVFVDADARIRVEVVKAANACPVCTLAPAFEEPFDTCPRCGWINDPLQRGAPDAYGQNLMTLGEAMRAWETGKPVR